MLAETLIHKLTYGITSVITCPVCKEKVELVYTESLILSYPDSFIGECKCGTSWSLQILGWDGK